MQDNLHYVEAKEKDLDLAAANFLEFQAEGALGP